MKQYLELLRKILAEGIKKPTRAKLQSTGENVHAISLFGPQVEYNLADGFPLVTTKKMPFKTIAHELIWFLRGDVNVNYLWQNNVHIWDQWVGADGTIGAGYGKQWRAWQGKDRRVDQIHNLIRNIREVIREPTYPAGRRLILSAWNVAEIDDMNLPPCHCLSQFMVEDGKLSCKLYQRSADAFLGVPFNVASYALLTHILAHVTGLEAGRFIHSFGDVHIYENHLSQVEEQLGRPHTFPLPSLRLVNIKYEENFVGLNVNNFQLSEYKYWPSLRAEVAV